jgi:hypothetical protein
MKTPMWGGSITREELLRSITLFQSLDKVPELPGKNVFASEISSARHFSVLREKQISSNLAFLSATSDDNRRVMAVCVEEHPDKQGITIRLASNTGDISQAVNGFRNIARILEGASRRGGYWPGFSS